MKLIIKNGYVVATHADEQRITQKMYPDCEIVSYNGSFKMGMDRQLDPRTEEEKKLAYRDKRSLEYPSVQDQLDMMYRDAANKTTSWVDSITMIKNKYPKI